MVIFEKVASKVELDFIMHTQVYKSWLDLTQCFRRMAVSSDLVPMSVLGELHFHMVFLATVSLPTSPVLFIRERRL